MSNISREHLLDLVPSYNDNCVIFMDIMTTKFGYKHYDNMYDLVHFKSYHLYVTTDEDEVKEGDYCLAGDKGVKMTSSNMDVYFNSWSLAPRKIIASTDNSLGLPLIPKSFVLLFIDNKNAGNTITRCSVGYKEWTMFNGSHSDTPTVLKLLVSPKTKEIDITTSEKTFTTIEVINLCREAFTQKETVDFNEWLNSNIKKQKPVKLLELFLSKERCLTKFKRDLVVNNAYSYRAVKSSETFYNLYLDSLDYDNEIGLDLTKLMVLPLEHKEYWAKMQVKWTEFINIYKK